MDMRPRDLLASMFAAAVEAAQPAQRIQAALPDRKSVV